MVYNDTCTWFMRTKLGDGVRMHLILLFLPEVSLDSIKAFIAPMLGSRLTKGT